MRADAPNTGTHYRDRMSIILGCCMQCGVLRQEDKHRYRDGHVEYDPVILVRSDGRVVVSSQYEKYALSVDPRVLQRVLGLGPQFALALNVPVVVVEVEGDTVWVRVPTERQGDLLFAPAWRMAPVQRGALLLGQTDDGAQAVLGLGNGSSNVHCAVIGMSGSGKSTLLRTMILSAQLTGARVALLDVADGFRSFSGHPAVWCGGDFETPERCAAALRYLAQRIEARESFGLLYVFVDEVPSLVHQCKAAAQSLGAIAARGRHSGVHLVLGAQHATSGTVGGVALANITVSIVGRVRNPLDAYTGAGRSQTGAHLLRGHGDMLVVRGQDATHIQAAMIEADFIRRWEERYPPRRGQLPAPIHSAPVVTAQAPAPVIAPTSDGDAGRPMEEPSPEMVQWCYRWMTRHGGPPSLTRIMTESKRRYEQGGYNRPKSYRTIARAADLLHRRCGTAPGASEILARANAKVNDGRRIYGQSAI